MYYFRRSTNLRKQYVRESEAKVQAEAKCKDIRMQLDKANKKLIVYDKREVSMLHLRRAVNSAEIRADQVQKELASVTVERDRATERFAI